MTEDISVSSDMSDTLMLSLHASCETIFFLNVFQKITVAECIETQSKAMMMLTIDQLSYLLKFALQKMKQPGVSILVPLVLEGFRATKLIILC